MKSTKPTRWPLRRVVLWLATALVLGIAAVAGHELHATMQRGRQIGTQATLQDMTFAIRQFEKRTGEELNGARLRPILVQIQGGLDTWGNPILSTVCPNGDGYSVLLVSPGADGVLDVESMDSYCRLNKQVSVAGDFDKDIVFRDGRPLRSGGK